MRDGSKRWRAISTFRFASPAASVRSTTPRDSLSRRGQDFRQFAGARAAGADFDELARIRRAMRRGRHRQPARRDGVVARPPVQRRSGTNACARSVAKRWTWIERSAAGRGAGEIVLNCMDSDGVRTGYDIEQLRTRARGLRGAADRLGRRRRAASFSRRVRQADVDGALAASVFHTGALERAVR